MRDLGAGLRKIRTQLTRLSRIIDESTSAVENYGGRIHHLFGGIVAHINRDVRPALLDPEGRSLDGIFTAGEVVSALEQKNPDSFQELVSNLDRAKVEDRLRECFPELYDYFEAYSEHEDS